MKNYNLDNAIRVTLLWMMLPLAGWAQLVGGPEVEIELKLRDDAGNPVSNVNTGIHYIGVVPNTGESFRQVSPANGIVKAKSALNGQVKIVIDNDGYYPVVWPRYLIRGMWDGSNKIQEEIILRKIEAPRALFSKKAELVIPKFEQWLGFDLQKGDWLAPHGIGEIADVEFWGSSKFLGFAVPEEDFRGGINSDLSEERLRKTYGKWFGELRLRVAGEGGGIYREKERYQGFTQHSLSVSYAKKKNWEMRMPHLAPEDGYQAEPLVWKKEPPHYSPPNVDPKVGYFLRTRVKLDEKGKIVSANYSKIVTSDAKYQGSDIYFDPRGKISFIYYFNPTVNDRNLEFDPRKNLFPNLKDKEKVRLP